MMRSQISATFDSAPFIGLVFQARMPTQKYTLDLPRLVPEVECLITVDLVAQLVGQAGFLPLLLRLLQQALIDKGGNCIQHWYRCSIHVKSRTNRFYSLQHATADKDRKLPEEPLLRGI